MRQLFACSLHHQRACEALPSSTLFSGVDRGMYILKLQFAISLISTIWGILNSKMVFSEAHVMKLGLDSIKCWLILVFSCFGLWRLWIYLKCYIITTRAPILGSVKLYPWKVLMWVVAIGFVCGICYKIIHSSGHTMHSPSVICNYFCFFLYRLYQDKILQIKVHVWESVSTVEDKKQLM